MMFLFFLGFLEVTWIDILDIILVSLLLYQVYRLLKGSVAVKIFLGVLLVYSVYLLVKVVGMHLLQRILGQFIGVGVIAAFILFQQEIRKFLMLIGKTTNFNSKTMLKEMFSKKEKETEEQFNINAIIESANILSSTKTGALIVFAKTSELKFYAESGDILDAELSKRLLIAIFQKYSPLHDGSVIVTNNRIKAARCILPVSENEEIPAHLGLRHRAAIGITEVTDSVVLIVSEETGNTSLAYNGKIFPVLAKNDLKNKLKILLSNDGSAIAHLEEKEEKKQNNTAPE
ncbi:MAG TPA: diadenylate cyclase CdaA [Cytophagaceae bacterium]|jgi:diadenylate cyclase|nr:diadenylate cyclase CdaA [Cytophagaceae bacterium]